MVRGTCAVNTPRRLPGDYISGKRKDISEQLKKKTFTVQSRTMFATNPSSKLTSSRCLVSSVMTEMNASSWKKIVSPSCASFKTVIVFFEAFKLFFKPLLDLFPRRSRFVPISSDCYMFVIQSFAFWFRFCKVTALIQWPLNTFCIHRNFSRISRSDFFLAMLPHRNGLPMRFHRIE